MKAGKVIVEIHSGEYYVSANSDEVITTLLGSCISVCLYDAERGIGGMNHFMLPYAKAGENLNIRDPRYGNFAMELLVQDILGMGGRLDRLKAKVFGGGEMIRTEQYNVAQENAEYACTYLKEKGIPILAIDIGGKNGRKIYYQLSDYQVFVRKNIAAVDESL
ncbi:MAG TPA: chemotaxis protein CheD [Bacillota bacterium]|nr:chemotaxis protein CheD [Bacillota bacterium]